MEDFNSKYSGEQVEELLDQVASGSTGGGGGGITAETDPVFLKSPAASITEEKIVEWNNKYAKPQTGIPKTDLAADVQSSLEKANKAQPTLISGTSIKTINNESILGSGNIAISGDGGKEFVEVEPIFEPGGSTGSFMPENPLQPNKVYVFTETISSLSINSIEASNSIVDEYTVMFTAASTNVVISINYKYQVYWANGVTPSVVEGDMCELSLVRIGNDIKAVLTPFKTV